MTLKKNRAIAQCATAGLVLMLLSIGCSAIFDFDKYKIGDDSGTGDTDTDTDADGDNTPVANVTSGSGTFQTETVKGWITIGGVLPNGSVTSESYRIKVGLGPMVQQ